MHSDGIGNYFELQRIKKKNGFKACTLVVFKKILNCSKKSNNENKDGIVTFKQFDNA